MTDDEGIGSTPPMMLLTDLDTGLVHAYDDTWSGPQTSPWASVCGEAGDGVLGVVISEGTFAQVNCPDCLDCMVTMSRALRRERRDWS